METLAAVPATPARIPAAAWYALFILTAANALNYVDRQIVSILAQSIKVDLKLDDADLGFILGTAFADMEKRLRTGETFTSALAAALPSLPPYVNQLAASGEAIGHLGQALEDAADQMAYDGQIRMYVVNALIYPTILVGAGVTAGATPLWALRAVGEAAVARSSSCGFDVAGRRSS